jgi:hypothetical protein
MGRRYLRHVIIVGSEAQIEVWQGLSPAGWHATLPQ